MILSILKKFLKICTFSRTLTSARRSWVKIRTEKADGSGSAMKKQLDPDPQQMNADPQPWCHDG